jgi:hypothetical protein
MLYRITFNAPEGKLGIHLLADRSNEKLRNVVSGVNHDSPLAGKIKVGDHLIKFNDISVRKMTIAEILSLFEAHEYVHFANTLTIARRVTDEPRSDPVDTDLDVDEFFGQKRSDPVDTDLDADEFFGQKDERAVKRKHVTFASYLTDITPLNECDNHTSEYALETMIEDGEHPKPIDSFIDDATEKAQPKQTSSLRPEMIDDDESPMNIQDFENVVVKKMRSISAVKHDADVESQAVTLSNTGIIQDMSVPSRPEPDVPHGDDESSSEYNNRTNAAVMPRFQETVASSGAYEVPHATLVDPDSEHIYDAEPIPKLPFWKRYARGIIISIIVLFVSLIGIVVPIVKGTQPSTLATPSLPYLWNSCVTYHGPLFESNCDGCDPYVKIDGNNTMALVTNQSVNFFALLKNGDMTNTTSLDINYESFAAAVDVDVAAIGAQEENNFTGLVFMYEKVSFYGLQSLPSLHCTSFTHK